MVENFGPNLRKPQAASRTFKQAYAEMVFLDTLWPDFDRRHLWYGCELYAKRDRRYGRAIPNPVAPAI